jgi:hypothetical protein
MANDTDLLAALKAAHDAGDEPAAIAIAQQLASMPVTPEVRPAPAQVGPDDKPGGANWEAKYGPTSGMSFADRVAAGAGESLYNTARGIKQLFGGQTQDDTDDQRRMDAPLEHTGGGFLGNVLGGVAQYALPGLGVEAAGAKIASKLATSPNALNAAQAVYRAAAPAVGGAATAAMDPVGSGETRAGNAGIGAIAGEAGHTLGTGVAGLLRAGEDPLSRGARIGADIAKKYGVPLTMPQMTGGFTGLVASALDKLPFSGAKDRIENQRGKFNDALGKISGIPDAQGALNTDMSDTAHDVVGGGIGTLAAQHTATATPQNIGHMLSVVQDADANATPENAAAVRAKVQQLLAHMDPGTWTINGDAWRQANSALGRQIRSESDGDLRHYLGQLQEPYMDMMQQGMPQTAQDQFRALRTQYRNLKTVAPLIEKSGNAGVNPNLVQGRAIAAKNNRGPMQDLGSLGKEMLTSKYPDSFTAQRAAIYGMGAALAGGLGNEILGKPEGENQHTGSAIAAVGLPILGGLAGRVLHSRPLARYAAARMPDSVTLPLRYGTANVPVGNAVRAATKPLPVVAAQTVSDETGPDDPQPQQMFKDLVQ